MTTKQSTQKAPPKSKRKAQPQAKAKKPVPQRKGSVAEFVDKLMLEGATWDELLAKAKAEAEKRGQKQFATMGQVKAHAKARARSKSYNVKMTDKRVTMTQAK